MKKYLLMMLSLFFAAGVWAQGQTITGTVTDGETGETVPGANVIEKGTSNGTTTDFDGNYRLTVSDNAVLVVSFVGFRAQEVSVGSRSVVDVGLELDVAQLAEVIVIGYGAVKKSDLTGSVVAVNADDLVKGVVLSPDQALQGKIAGVQVLNNSGQPGGSTTVRVRGNASIRAGNGPLFVVDGVQLTGVSSRPGGQGGGVGSTLNSNPLNFINPNDIANMQVLKDASATAIYGSRGANGVILITTKRGSAGKTSVDINSQVGFSSILNEYDILDASAYRGALTEFGVTGADADGGSSTDAMDAILRTAVTHSHNVSLSGGSDNAVYRVSIGYFDQEGIIQQNQLQRANFNLSGNFKFLEDRGSVDVVLIGSNTTEDTPPIGTNSGFQGSLIGNALQWNPTYPLRDGNGNILISQPGVAATTINPLSLLELVDDVSEYNDILVSVSPSIKVTDNLTYRLTYNVARGFGERRGQFNGRLNVQGIEGIGQAFFAQKSFTNQILTQTMEFVDDISSSVSLNALVGYEFQNREENTNAITATDFSVDGDYFNFLQNAEETLPIVDAEPVQKLSSFFARTIFNVNDTYLFTGTLRADGSSKFGENNRFGVFPSLAAAWNVHNSIDLPFNELKFRLGWGITGNSEFEAGASQPRWNVGLNSVVLENSANPDLKWETSTTWNIGFDFAFMDYKLVASLDLFNKSTEDLLFQQQPIAPAPQSLFWLNLPGSEVLNRGIEIAIDYEILDQSDWKVNVGTNLTFLDNELTGYDGANVVYGQVFGQGTSNTTIHRLEEGQPLNAFYMQRFTGLDSEGLSTFANDGAPEYVGDPNQDVLLGITSKVGYKDLTLTLNFNGAFGHDIYNNTLHSVLPITNLGTRNIAEGLLGSGENPANAIQASSRYLEKGDYLKLNNATISYDLGQLSVFNAARIYVTGNNLLVFTNYTGFDPEVNTPNTDGGLPSFGIEYIPYPSARTFLLGVNLSF